MLTHHSLSEIHGEDGGAPSGGGKRPRGTCSQGLPFHPPPRGEGRGPRASSKALDAADEDVHEGVLHVGLHHELLEEEAPGPRRLEGSRTK